MRQLAGSLRSPTVASFADAFARAAKDESLPAQASFCTEPITKPDNSGSVKGEKLLGLDCAAIKNVKDLSNVLSGKTQVVGLHNSNWPPPRAVIMLAD